MNGAVTPIEEIYSQRQMASRIAAERIATAMQRRLHDGEEGSLVVSGGSTPARCLEVLSETALDWHRVHVVPSDERWVARGHEDSNERMIRERLLQHRAAGARFVSLLTGDESPDRAVGSVTNTLRPVPRPFTCSLLGMGDDGHFASLFPDFPGLTEALDSEGTADCVAVSTAASPHPRMSLTLAALHDSCEIVLLIFSEEKWRVYEAARDGETALPVAALFRQSRHTVRVVWAP